MTRPVSTNFKIDDLFAIVHENDVDVILSCRKICKILNELELNDERFLIFKGIESETDHIPMGELRKSCEKTYLSKIDDEIKSYLLRIKNDLIDKFQKILRDYSLNFNE